MFRLTFALCTLFSTFSSIEGYGSPYVGPCRGPGGENDKVNSRHAGDMTRDQCQDACSALSACVGYAYCESCNNGECVLYGSRLDGTCSDSSALNEVACEALGSCSDSTKTSEDTCGVCSESTAPTDVLCSAVGATWTAGTWTSSNEVWSDAEDPWTGDSHYSTVIDGSTGEPTSTYICVDAEPEDHLAHCTGSTTCENAFKNLAEAERIEDNCLDGCTFVAAPTVPKEKPPHAGDIKLPGWDAAMSGACRGGATFTNKVNGKYSNKAGANGGPPTQEECAKECIAELECIGYAHSTAWCIVYGPNIDETPGSDWTSDSHEAVSITGTKANPSYICVTGPPRGSGGSNGNGNGNGDGSGNGNGGKSAASSLNTLHLSIALFTFLIANIMM
jgi:hypothetical protein